MYLFGKGLYAFYIKCIVLYISSVKKACALYSAASRLKQAKAKLVTIGFTVHAVRLVKNKKFTALHCAHPCVKSCVR